MSQELAAPKTVAFPNRWTLRAFDDPMEAVSEINSLAQTLVTGAEAISGVYMRMCDVIRKADLPDWKVRQQLGKYFPQPRVSEIMKVARASDEVYLRYSAGFFGFKSALKQCRAYSITPSQELKRRQVRRAAERLIALLGHGEVQVKDSKVTISKA